MARIAEQVAIAPRKRSCPEPYVNPSVTRDGTGLIAPITIDAGYAVHEQLYNGSSCHCKVNDSELHPTVESV